MTTNTWTSSTTGNWSTGASWTDTTAPTTGEDVLIQSSPAASLAYTITYDVASLTINSLTLNDSKATLRFKSAGTESLTVSGATTITAGTFSTLISTDTFTTGSLTINGGTWSPANGTRSIGSLTVSSGTFTAGGGSSTVTGLASFTGGTDKITGGTFNAGTLSIANNFTMSGGTTTTQSGGGGATVSGGKTLTMSGASTVLDATNGGLTVTGGSTVSGLGTIKGAISGGTGVNTLKASGGTLLLNDTVNAGPIWSIDSTKASSDLKLAGTATDSQPLSLTSANQTLEVASTGNVTLSQKLSSFSGGLIQLDGGSLTATAGINFTGTALAPTIKGSGTLSGALSVTSGDNGTVRASGGTLELVNAIAASSGINFIVGTTVPSVLKFDGTIGSGNTVSFAAPAAASTEINYANAAALTTTIGVASSATNFGLDVGSSAAAPGTNFIDFSNHTVTVTSGFSGSGTSGTVGLSDGSTLTLANLTGLTGGTWFVDTIADSGSGTELFLSTAACYLRGTRILTVDGEVPVEDLSEGDMIVTASGATRPVKWIGKRGYVTRLVSQHQRPAILPIRFVRGSLGEGLPKRDLFVSPEHMMFLDDVLIPARNLVNGTSIAYCDSFPVIEYFHVELPSHDVILAEGAAAESWLDTGNRNMFANVLEYQPRDSDDVQGEPCAPIVTEGPQLVAVRSQLQTRIASTGFELTADPDLHLLAGDLVVHGCKLSDTAYRFELAELPSKLAIASLVSVPRDVDPASTDRRPLGVCLKRIVLKGAHASLEIAHDEPTLVEGYHGAESSHRWTTGTATIPAQFLACLSGPLTVEVQLAAVNLRYARRAGGMAVVIPLSADRRDVAVAA